MASKYSSSYRGGVNVKGRCSFAFFSACWCSNFARSLRMSAGDLPEDEREYTAGRSVAIKEKSRGWFLIAASIGSVWK